MVLQSRKKGQPDATYYLGNFYGHPMGFDVVEPSDEKKLDYWSKAIELGSARAMCELGRWYRQGGLGIEKKRSNSLKKPQNSNIIKLFRGCQYAMRTETA